MSSKTDNGDEIINTEEGNQKGFPEESFPFDVKKQWKEPAPTNAPNFSSSNNPSFPKEIERIESGTDGQKRDAASKNRIVAIDKWRATAPVNQWYVKANLPVLPFYHLIPAERITKGLSVHASPNTALSSATTYQSRMQLFWQSLASAGVPAKEASLFDDVIEYRTLERDDEGNIAELNWEVNHYSALAGCAEIYRAEMMFFKRLIYQAGDNLSSTIELSTRDLFFYLNSEVFEHLTEQTPEGLFFDSLLVSFRISYSSNHQPVRISETGEATANRRETSHHQDKNGQQSRNKSKFSSMSFNTDDALLSGRFESLSIMKKVDDHNTANDKDNDLCNKNNDSSDNQTNASLNNQTDSSSEYSNYRLALSNYWLEWQQAARRAGFDFDLLAKLTDARAIRFYELTKLCRSLITPSKENEIPDKLEIDYEKFVSLMPLPAFRTEREIKIQIRDLTKSLKASGYVKSFRLKSDWRTFSQAYTLIFRFSN